jgi:general L-amino acid transport system substrate-binding protein
MGRKRRGMRNAMRVLMIGAMAAVLLAAGCGRRDAEPTLEETGATALTPAVASDRPASPTLTAVKRRGRLNCGVHQGLVGFAYTDNRGQWRGFDADFCRAMAAAIFGDGDAVRFVPLSASERFDALNEGRVDVLWRNSSWNMSRDAGDGFVFAGINYYDGQGFLVRRSLNLNSATELNGARVCVQAGSTAQANADDFFRSRGIAYRPVVLQTEEAARDAYGREDCDAFSADISALAAARTVLADSQAHTILSDVVSKEPLGPVVKAGTNVGLDRALDPERSDAGRRTRGHQGQCRGSVQDATDPRVRASCWAPRASSAPCWGCRTTGPRTRSKPSGIMARSSNEIWDRNRRSTWRAV